MPKDRALYLLNSVQNRYPPDAEIALELGNLAVSNLEREEKYRTALFLQPDRVEAREKYVEFLINIGKPAQALDLISSYLDASKMLRILQARALYSLGFFEQSAEKFAELIHDRAIDSQKKLGEDACNILDELWLSEFQSGWYSKAQETARIGIHSCSFRWVWYLRSALALREMGNLELAYRALKHAKASGLEDEEWVRFEYELAFSQQDYPAAEEWLTQWIQAKPRTPMKGDLSWVESQRLLVWSLVGKRAEILDHVSQMELGATGWALAASVVNSGKDPELALTFANKAIQDDPRYFPGLAMRAKALEEMGRESEAAQAYRDLRVNFPNEHSAYEHLSIYTLLNGNLVEALELADRAVALGAFCSRAWATRGLVHFLIGQVVDARQDLTICWNRASNFERAKIPEYWMALNAVQNRFDRVDEWRQRAQEIPSTPLSSKILKLVEKRLDQA
jgi:tetratricopeptide (TPR) repeat protein